MSFCLKENLSHDYTYRVHLVTMLSLDSNRSLYDLKTLNNVIYAN